MSEVLVMVGVSVTAFLSTNLDNLFLLMALMSDGETRTRDATLGYAGSITLVLTLGLAGSYAADLADDAWLRYLGFVPLGLGMWRLAGLLRGAPADSSDQLPPRAGGPLLVFGVMLANSGDSLGVFASLMAETPELLVVVIFATAVGMACAWPLAARWIVEHPNLAPRLRKIDRYAVPALLITIGLYVLADTPTDTV